MINILSLYNPISNAAKKSFRSHTTLRSFKKNELLLVDGEIQEELFLVKSGTTMLYYDNEGEAEVLDFAYYNRFCLDVESFAKQEESRFCIKCIEDCEIESITHQDLNTLFDESPEIERAYRFLLESILSATINRILNQHILTIEQRFLKMMETRPELFKIAAHKHLASYLNMDPTNFSKLYNDCRKRKINFY